MTASENKDRAERRKRYVWDPEKLAWVEGTEEPGEEAEATPAEEAVAQRSSAGEAVAGQVAEEALVAEAAEGEPLVYKGVLVRAAGALIDFIALLIISAIIRYTVGQVVSLPTYALLVYGIIYFVGFWWWRGQTPGKMIIGAKIVRIDGTRMGVDRALLRFVLYLFPAYAPLPWLSTIVTGWLTYILPLIGLVVMALNREKRGIHDFVAGTCVINTRIAVPPPEEVESTGPEQSGESGADTSGQV